MSKRSPFRYFKTSPEIIRMALMMYIRFPLSQRSLEDLLHQRGIDVSHETVRFWWHRFRPIFAAEIRRKRIYKLRAVRRQIIWNTGGHAGLQGMAPVGQGYAAQLWLTMRR